MASVKRFKGCKLWYACYSVYTGQVNEKGKPVFKRVQRPTRLTDQSEALRLALSYEHAAKKAAAKAWHEIEAKNLVQQVSALVGNTVSRVESASEFINSWLDSAARQGDSKGEKTIKNYRGIVRDFLEYLGPRADRPIHEIGKSVVIGFRENELKAGKQSPTVNKALGVLKQAFQHAVTLDAMLQNPVEAGVLLKRTRSSAQKRRAFTFEQFKKLVEVTDPKHLDTPEERISPEWQTLIMICGYTGGRQQEPAKLRWEQIDFKRGVIVLARTKQRDEHLMPMHPSLVSHLKSLRRKKVGYVMPTIASEKGQALSKIFREVILPRIGIVQPYHTKKDDPSKGVGRRLAPYSIHSLRHSLSTWLNEVGVPGKSAAGIHDVQSLPFVFIAGDGQMVRRLGLVLEQNNLMVRSATRVQSISLAIEAAKVLHAAVIVPTAAAAGFAAQDFTQVELKGIELLDRSLSVATEKRSEQLSGRSKRFAQRLSRLFERENAVSPVAAGAAFPVPN